MYFVTENKDLKKKERKEKTYKSWKKLQQYSFVRPSMGPMKVRCTMKSSLHCFNQYLDQTSYFAPRNCSKAKQIN